MRKFSFLIFFVVLTLTLSGVSAGEINATDDIAVADDEQGILLDEAENQSVLKDSSQVTIESKDLVKYYKNDSQFNFKVSYANSTPLSGAEVALSINGNNYVQTTDSNGSGTLTVNLAPGDYTIKTSYANTSVTNAVKVLSRVSSKDVTTTYGKQTAFSLKVLDKQGNPMVNESVTFKVSSKTYEAYTNAKGVASIKLSLNAGSYTIKYYVDGVSGKNSFKVKNSYKITTYKWNTGADVTKNKLIKANIPNSAAVKKIVKAAKSGTPVIKFKGGSGKVVFITAGVHGNELSSQVAAMKLIKYLENHPIKGTVYIMPFMHPKATSKNVRDYSVKLNSHANVKGTVSYKTVRLIVKFKCRAYGDFHCTRPGGKPGKNVAMGTYKPTAKSATLAKYISKKSKVSCIIYSKAGAEYPGAMEDEVSLKGIPAVTCEVITPHGTIASGSVSKSLSMMKSFLKFSSLI